MAGSDCHRIRSIRHILEEKVLKKDMAESLKGVLKV